ncbi:MULTISPECIES: VanZ family protein [Butyricimonas]|uniref:VanZ family protein n=1 Tax=Butyricimonas hominis TaxID=2763032 RepID=A0ABR7CXU3_9BACT|nr:MULTISPECIES: VanZ family protein [Butyricimonas]MBC5619980.1 VanZ family protein [Butyricimonas hominis]
MIAHKHVLLWCNLLWAGVIFFLCAIPSSSIPDPKLNIPHLDKVVHFGMFFIMSVFLCDALRHKLSSRACYLIAIGFSFAYGGLIEILQYKYFHRGGDWWDLLADVLGGIAGCLLYPTAKKIMDKLVARFCKNTRDKN